MQKAFNLIKERLEEEINDVIVKDTYSKGKNAGLRKAKIIVNEVAEEYVPNTNVGDNEEVCEWKPDVTLSHTLTAHEHYESMVYICEWEYCPYCGKKIKVVE